MTKEAEEIIQEALDAGREACLLLARIQAIEEGDFMMPWPEEDRLSLALDDLESII